MGNAEDSDEEWARTLCRGTRRSSPTPPERLLRELSETMPNKSRTNVPTYPIGSEPQLSDTQPAPHKAPEGVVTIRDQKDIICIGGRDFVRGRDWRGQVRLLPTPGSTIPTPARAQAARPPPRPPTTPVVVRVRSCGGPTTPTCMKSASPALSSSSSSSTPKASPLPPPLEPPQPPQPPQPPSAADMPAGPLELPKKEHRRDSDSEDSSEEERDYKLDVHIQPRPRDMPHIIHWRLVRAAYNEIGVDWCKSISYEEWPDRVKALCIYRIEMERLRLGGPFGGTRFKIGITHCPRWRFIDARDARGKPYAYTREDPPWG